MRYTALTPLSSGDAIQTLVKYLLGEDYDIVDPVNGEQGNAIIVDDILRKYSRKYRKQLKAEEKLKKKELRLKDELDICKKSISKIWNK